MGRKATITSIDRIEREQRTAVILQMRCEGHTLRDIGQAMDPPVSGVAVFKTIKRALERMVSEAVEQARELEALRLDELTVGIYPAALNGDLACVDRVLSIQARRSRLMGLDAAPVRVGVASDTYDEPPKVRVEVVGSPDAGYIRRLEQRLRLLEGGDPPRSVRVN
jgi:hypothetical protein